MNHTAFNITFSDFTVIRDVVKVWPSEPLDAKMKILRRLLKDIHTGHFVALGYAIGERENTVSNSHNKNHIFYESQN